MNKENGNLMDNIFQMLLEESLENALKEDLGYIKSKKEMHIAEEMYMKLDLAEEGQNIIQKYVETTNYVSSIYGECAYRTGFKDCLKILNGLGIIK